MIASYTAGLAKCRRPAVTKTAPRRRGIRMSMQSPVARYEQPRVPIGRRAGEVLRAAALGVEVGELSRDSREPLAVVVDHPRLERDAFGGLLDAEHARLLREVGERGGADQP